MKKFNLTKNIISQTRDAIFVTKNVKFFVDGIKNTKFIITNLILNFHRQKQFDFLTIITLLTLGYALMRSGTFLIFYLLIWNIYPATQYYILYNPVSFEIYLLILSFLIAWYNLRLLLLFPKQFQIHLWIFHRLLLDNLDYLSNRYIGKNYHIFEKFWIFCFFFIICCWPKFGLFLLWGSTLCIELYCLDNIRKPQVLLFIPKWVKFLDDIEDSENNEISEIDTILPEEDYSMLTMSPVWTLWEYEEEISEPQNQPYPDFTVEDFEAFFAENTFIPPVVTDLYEDEFKDGWVNWFWLNLFYKLLPFLCFLNIIICVLFFLWGIPESFYIDMQICDVIVQDFLAEYQRMLLIYTNTYWSSSWKWLIGGIGFRTYFKKYGIGFFNVSSDTVADNLLNEYKKYIKYTYYLNHDISRKGRIFSQIFPFYYEYLQIKFFFSKIRDFTTPLRETFLHKYFFYDDLFLYQKLKEIISIHRSQRGFTNKKKKEEIFSWLHYKSKTWAKDYYYTTPAVHIFPEKHFVWLDLLRMFFVAAELDIFPHNTFANVALWIDQDPWAMEPEAGQHFLEQYMFDFGDREIWLDYDSYEYDNELYTMLKHPGWVGRYITYFADTHPRSAVGSYSTLPPQFYMSYANGKIDPEPDYITQESFDYEMMRFKKFTYIELDSDDEKLLPYLEEKYAPWIDKKYLNPYIIYKQDYDWSLEWEDDEENDFFQSNLWQTSDYEILFSYYHQANLDILPDLLQDMDPVQLQNKTFFSYVHRNDPVQYPNRRRSFLYNQMLQTFAYAATAQKDARYNIADLYELIETTPNVYLGQSFDFLMQNMFGKYTTTSSDISKKYIKGYDSRATRTELFKTLSENNWYKYYYKVDTIMDYYDYMPSYRKFFIKTWPLEYTDTPYNFFGKVNTVISPNNWVFTGDDWIIYIPTNHDLYFLSPLQSLGTFNDLLFDPILFL